MRTFSVLLGRSQSVRVEVEAANAERAEGIAWDMLYEGSIDDHKWEEVDDSWLICNVEETT